VSGVKRYLVAVWCDAICDASSPPLRGERRPGQLGRTAKLTALVLATFMNVRGYAYPGRETLARKASLSDRAVDAAIVELEDEGFLSVEPPRRPIATKRGVVLRRSGGKQATNRYQAQLPLTANALRTSEWARCERHALKSEAHALNSERASHEGSEGAEGGALGAAPAFGAAGALTCPECETGAGLHAVDCSKAVGR
jgi:Helix-turn-helix domain